MMGRIISNLLRGCLFGAFAVISTSGSAPSCLGFSPVHPKSRTAHGRGSQIRPAPGQRSGSFPFTPVAKPTPKGGAAFHHHRDARLFLRQPALSARDPPSSGDEEEEVADSQEKSVVSGWARAWRGAAANLWQHRQRFVSIARMIALAVAVWLFLPHLWVALKFFIRNVGYFLRELWWFFTLEPWEYEEKLGRLPPGADPITYGKVPRWMYNEFPAIRKNIDNIPKMQPKRPPRT